MTQKIYSAIRSYVGKKVLVIVDPEIAFHYRDIFTGERIHEAFLAPLTELEFHVAGTGHWVDREKMLRWFNTLAQIKHFFLPSWDGNLERLLAEFESHAGISLAQLPPKMEKVHRCPIGNESVTPCCGKAPFELAGTSRMTLDDSLVTCVSKMEEPKAIYPRVYASCPCWTDERNWTLGADGNWHTCRDGKWDAHVWGALINPTPIGGGK